MPRIDLFTSPHCPSCPEARSVVAGFAAAHPEVELHEWDLATDPGPAVGRGIFVTPSLLLDGVEILLGVPSESDLARRFTPPGGATKGPRRVLVLNAYADFLRRPVFDGLTGAGYEPWPADSVEAAVRAIGAESFSGAVVALNPVVDVEGQVTRSGIGLWAEVLARVTDRSWATRPILVTATSRASVPLVQAELERHSVRNPVLIATKSEVTEPHFSAAVLRHLGKQ